ncbi:hypothetical protein ThidrDRAFT_1215 [Thiorhodococcus drewsii AZ1]|uniref:Uncharacterized protein n=1 Tax=Thiorhodococcus drewsii AZ1 TaxID=765913 RepID=G2DZ12_9GAMM|nr:hypothetical protein ThidrDRAFT_1215 [Thiorhodococcus drewsii AZ1]
MIQVGLEQIGRDRFDRQWLVQTQVRLARPSLNQNKKGSPDPGDWIATSSA